MWLRLEFNDLKEGEEIEVGMGLYAVKMQDKSVTEYLNNFYGGDGRITVELELSRVKWEQSLAELFCHYLVPSIV